RLPARPQIAPRPPARAGRRRSRAGRWQLDARPPRFRQADGDRLLRRARAVLALADMVDLLAHELARLRRGRLALRRILPGAPDRLLVGHGIASCADDASAGATWHLVAPHTRRAATRSASARAAVSPGDS